MDRSGYVRPSSGQPCAHSLNSDLHAARVFNCNACSPCGCARRDFRGARNVVRQHPTNVTTIARVRRNTKRRGIVIVSMPSSRQSQFEQWRPRNRAPVALNVGQGRESKVRSNLHSFAFETGRHGNIPFVGDGSIRVVLTTRRPLPIYRDERTFPRRSGMSQTCRKRSTDRKSTRLNSSHVSLSRMPSSA